MSKQVQWEDDYKTPPQMQRTASPSFASYYNEPKMNNFDPILQTLIDLLLLLTVPPALARPILHGHFPFVERVLTSLLIYVHAFPILLPDLAFVVNFIKAGPILAPIIYFGRGLKATGHCFVVIANHLAQNTRRALHGCSRALELIYVRLRCGLKTARRRIVVVVNRLVQNTRHAIHGCSRAINSLLARILSTMCNIPAFICILAQIYVSVWLVTDSMLAAYLAMKEWTRSRACSTQGKTDALVQQLQDELEASKKENKALKAQKAAACVIVAGIRRAVKTERQNTTALKNKLHDQDFELDAVRGMVVELTEEKRVLIEEKVLVEKELGRSKEEAEVTKVENEQLRGDLESAKETIQDLTHQVTDTEASKEEEREKNDSTLREQVTSLGAIVKKVKMARLAALLVLKKEREDRAIEQAAAEKAKEEHAQEIKDLRLQLEEATTSANATASELKVVKQDKAAIREELHHVQGQLSVVSDQNAALLAKNQDLDHELEATKGRVVELTEEKRILVEEKVSVKEELGQSKKHVEVPKVENEELHLDLESAKKTIQDLKDQVTDANTSKDEEHKKRVEVEYEVSTLREQVSSLGAVVKKMKTASLAGLLVLKKEKDGRAAERAALEKVKEEHAQEMKDLRIELGEAKSLANANGLELEAGKQDKVAIQDELIHVRERLTIVSDEKATLLVKTQELESEVHELRSKGLGTTQSDEAISEAEVNNADEDEDDPLESLDTLRSYFASRDVKKGDEEVVAEKVDEHEEAVTSDDAEDTLLNENSDGSIMAEATELKVEEVGEDFETHAEECSSTVKDHNVPPVVPDTVNEEHPLHDDQTCTGVRELALPQDQDSSVKPEPKPEVIYETPRPVVQKEMPPVVACSRSLPPSLEDSLLLPTMTTNTDSADGSDVSSIPPQRKSRPRRRHKRGSGKGRSADQAEGVAAPDTSSAPASTSNRRRRSERPWFYPRA